MNCKIFDEKKLIAKFKVFVMTLLIISLLRFASQWPGYVNRRFTHLGLNKKLFNHG